VSAGTEQTPVDQVTEPDGGKPGLDLGRIGWLITTATLLIGMLILAFKRDWGYAGVTFAVAMSSAINLV
jgi:hypothetical protein